MLQGAVPIQNKVDFKLQEALIIVRTGDCPYGALRWHYDLLLVLRGLLSFYWFIFNEVIYFQGFENSEVNSFEILSTVCKANCMNLKNKAFEQLPFKSDFLTKFDHTTFVLQLKCWSSILASFPKACLKRLAAASLPVLFSAFYLVSGAACSADVLNPPI